ncbi:MAG: aspartate carbamoyltransferase, partial [Pseudomonadota bacterium]
LPIINAGDGFHEHPTQALLDLMTIFERKKQIRGTRVLIVGDIAHSRVARSNIYALKTMGAEVSVCGPPTLLPPKVEKMGVKVFYEFEKAVREQDVVMMLRIQFERLSHGQSPSQGEYARFYGMNQRVLKLCRPDVLIMHPGPVNRGVELATDVADSSRSVILNQVSNGVLLRMSALHLLSGGEPLSRGEEIQ